MADSSSTTGSIPVQNQDWLVGNPSGIGAAAAMWIGSAGVLILGVILLNPRLIEYDAAPLALPAALIAWRFLAAIASPRRTILYFTLSFVAVNAIALTGWQIWKLTEGPLLVVLFAAGAYTLLRPRSGRVHDERAEAEAVLVRA